MSEENQDTGKKELSAVQAIKKYFGVKPEGYKGKEGLPALMEELKELKPADKAELGRLAAAELGATIKTP